jgi:hypothetical protein
MGLKKVCLLTNIISLDSHSAYNYANDTIVNEKEAVSKVR